jgi:antitoxin YefM
MKTVTATSARTDLYKLIDATLSDHEPIQITCERGALPRRHSRDA